MTSEQKYEGKGNSAQNPSQTVETRRFAPLSPDERSEMIGQLDTLQSQLLDLVDDFASIGYGKDPVSLIADLLQNLLTHPVDRLANEMTRDRLNLGLSLISFFSDARLRLHKRDSMLNALEYGKEVIGE